MQHVADSARRARLAVRHALIPSSRVGTPDEAARAVTALHATEPPSVYLSCWARVDGLTVGDVDRALYERRSLVRQLSMRQTIFAFPREVLPAVWGSAAARVAASHGSRLVKEVERGELAEAGRGAAWLEAAEQAVRAHLADGRELSARQLREQVPELAGVIEYGVGRAWGGRTQVAPRVLAQLSLQAEVMRAHNDGGWWTSHPLWTATSAWLGDVTAALPSRDGYATLVDRWLWSYGPGTVEDMCWWLGATKVAVRTALADLDAVEVSLDGGASGWLRPDDLDPVIVEDHWVALLPVLDPTVMGWKGRGFYLGSHGPALFDSAGNAGTTAWVDGRIVGAWVQDGDNQVRLRLLEDVSSAARAALEAEARRLSEWLDGQRVFVVYPSAAMR